MEDAEKYEAAWSAVREAAGVVIPGGFGVRGVEGKIAAAKYCRESRTPFLGICLGMQVRLRPRRTACELPNTALTAVRSMFPGRRARLEHGVAVCTQAATVRHVANACIATLAQTCTRMCVKALRCTCNIGSAARAGSCECCIVHVICSQHMRAHTRCDLAIAHCTSASHTCV